MPAPPDVPAGPPPGGYQAAPGAPVDQPPVDPRGLYEIGWLRIAVIGCQVASIPLALLDLLLSLLASVGGWVLLVIWSGLAVANAGRAKGPTRRTKPPSSTSVVVSWIAPVAWAIPALAIYGLMSAWVADATFDQEGGRQMILVCVALLFLVVGLILLYRPYSVLARATAWVAGDSSLMRRWFFAPFIAALIASVIQFLVVAYLIGGSLDGEVDDGATVALLLSAMSFGLPMVAWLIVGNRAMRELEGATKLTYQRNLHPHQPIDMATINPILAAQAQAGPYGAPPATMAMPGQPAGFVPAHAPGVAPAHGLAPGAPPVPTPAHGPAPGAPPIAAPAPGVPATHGAPGVVAAPGAPGVPVVPAGGVPSVPAPGGPGAPPASPVVPAGGVPSVPAPPAPGAPPAPPVPNPSVAPPPAAPHHPDGLFMPPSDSS